MRAFCTSSRFLHWSSVRVRPDIREEVGDMAVAVFRGLDGVEEMVVVEVIRVEEMEEVIRVEVVEAIAGGEAEVNDTE